MKPRIQSTLSFIFVATVLATAGCGNEAAAASPPECVAIVDRCHAFDTGSGPAHDCHAFADTATSAAECTAMQASCFATCTAAVDGGGGGTDGGRTDGGGGGTDGGDVDAGGGGHGHDAG